MFTFYLYTVCALLFTVHHIHKPMIGNDNVYNLSTILSSSLTLRGNLKLLYMRSYFFKAFNWALIWLLYVTRSLNWHSPCYALTLWPLLNRGEAKRPLKILGDGVVTISSCKVGKAGPMWSAAFLDFKTFLSITNSRGQCWMSFWFSETSRVLSHRIVLSKPKSSHI